MVPFQVERERPDIMPRRRLPAPALSFFLAAALLGGCASSGYEDGSASAGPPADQARPGSSTVQPGSPGSPSRHLGAEELRHRHELPHTGADVLFMQNMIHHHGQALVMSGLAPDRAGSDEIRLLAERIHRSQTDEIALMQRWLRERGEEAPQVDLAGQVDHAAHDQHQHHAPPAAHPEHELMAGMLTPEQLEELAGARGEAFDRLFLEFMIFHHEGAILMVDELFSVPGAAQDSEMYQFASHVDADQRIEIGRMHWMLDQRR
jgi:uncharacterized protein (DUF305 family)